MQLVFEKVGDIRSLYSYLCVYFREKYYCKKQEPFMEIGVTEERELEFIFYPDKNETELSLDELTSILDKGKLFLPEVLKNEYFSSVLEKNDSVHE